MARNGSGVYVAPAGQPVVTGTSISSTVENNLVTDLGNEITNSLPRDGQAPPTANIPMGNYKLTGLAAGSANGESVRYEQLSVSFTTLPDGTAAAPSLAFASNTNTGIYRNGADQIGFSAAGTMRMNLTAGGLSIPAGVLSVGANPSRITESGIATRISNDTATASATLELRLPNSVSGSTVVTFTNGGLNLTGTNGDKLLMLGTQVLTSRKTGWTAATGTAARTTFATSTVTTEELAKRVKALLDDLISHGVIGA